MFYIKDIIENKIIVNKSIFITTVIPVSSSDEVDEQLSLIRKKYYDATHNCYAYILGDKQEIQKASDDGEPQKTAGFPILDVIKKKEMTNVLVVVTRYFGGTLLGAGGLIRAYSSSASLALSKIDLYERQILLKTSIALSYKDYNQFIKYNYITIINEDFNTSVIVLFLLKEQDKEKLLKDLESLLRVDNLNLEFSKELELVKI